jgi:hypothetical protein
MQREDRVVRWWDVARIVNTASDGLLITALPEVRGKGGGEHETNLPVWPCYFPDSAALAD